jgi:predicted DNA-binding protein (MmcQ/YjbR family)
LSIVLDPGGILLPGFFYFYLLVFYKSTLKISYLFKEAKMNIESYREFCLGFPGVTEDFPFDQQTLVFKVMGKMFSLTDVDDFESINLKCDPEKAIQLREEFPGVKPGYHMNKKHWNTVMIDAGIPDSLLKQWTRDSYDLVVASLTRKAREELKKLASGAE